LLPAFTLSWLSEFFRLLFPGLALSLWLDYNVLEAPVKQQNNQMEFIPRLRALFGTVPLRVGLENEIPSYKVVFFG
jgi:hypothetical protein